MRRFIRNAPLRVFARSSLASFDPKAQQKTKTWSSGLSNMASSAASKIYAAQLAALINYYNRIATDITKPIDWNDWVSRIQTPGLVEKVKQNYEAQAKEEYDLDKLFTDVFSRDSKAIDEINSEMGFHTAIWAHNYFEYVHFLADLSSVSNYYDYNAIQQVDLYHGLEARVDAMVETHCYLFGSQDDVPVFNYISRQFVWGKKVTTYFRHPADDIKQGKATKNAMSR